MKLFGLTGGIGTGKSTAARLLSGCGMAVVDTDQLAHQLVEPGQPALAEIQQVFGAAIISADSRLRRDELARIVFADAAARKRLEAILHPRIREHWQAQVAAWRAEGRPAAVVVIPLLFETNATPEFDRTICLACSAETQRARLIARGWTPEQMDSRLAAQLPLAKKMELSDFVVWTEGREEMLAAQLQRLVP
jgi:dephospho-CoA kinase